MARDGKDAFAPRRRQRERRYVHSAKSDLEGHLMTGQRGLLSGDQPFTQRRQTVHVACVLAGTAHHEVVRARIDIASQPS